MPLNFYDFVDEEVRLALPPKCHRISADKLLGKNTYKIRYAFHTRPDNDRSRLVNILVLPEAPLCGPYHWSSVREPGDHAR
jgi:hypothetical protein